MRINTISLTIEKDTIILSANVAFKGEQPKKMFFSTSLANKDFVAMDASPFLAAILLPCMKLKEDIFIDGSVSETLLKNTEKIMDLMAHWKTDMRKITILVKKVTRDSHQPQYNGTFFSGGVDSFYTYLKHKKNPSEKITHFLLVHGFDIPLSNTDFFAIVEKRIRKVANAENISVISLKTNVADIIEPKLVWNWAHGGALAAAALMVRKKIKRVYISSGIKFDELFPYGTHPDLDKLWSTEKLTFSHDGHEYRRFEKIKYSIAKSPLALRHLRVCCQNMKGKYNCSKCFKCLNTMISLECVDALKKCRTFIYPLDLKTVSKMYYDYQYHYNRGGEFHLAILKKMNKKFSLRDAIAESLEKSKKYSLKKTIMKTVAHVDQQYNKRRLYTFVFTINKEMDRSILFKTLTNLGLIK